jgi:NAD(P)-dependent dehydrogenase (short-subunit alcohol dehydrogenase family)
MDLTGRVAMITGGAERVGKTLALALAKAGADIAISYIDIRARAEETRSEIQELGRKCLLVEADMRNAEQLGNLVDQTVQTFDRLDVLVHNASNFNNYPFFEVTEEIWDSSHDVILKGPFFLSMAAAKVMLRQKSGRIMAMIGDSYFENWPNFLPHAIAKTGLAKLMQGLAVALSPYVQCNAICPANILNSDSGTAIMENRGVRPELLADGGEIIRIHGQPVRLGTPEQVAELVVYLAGCSSYLNGAILSIDGGKHLI